MGRSSGRIQNVSFSPRIAGESPNDHERTSYVVISRGKSRFVDEVHIPDAALRPSPESLTERQRSEGRESCEEQTDTSIQVTVLLIRVSS